MNDIAVAITEKLIARWEGFSELPYLCPAGMPTIGYGFTHYEDGRRVTLKDPAMPKPIARAILERLVRRKYMPVVIGLCPGVDSAERLGALTDFCFNLGAGNLRASTLRRKVNDGDWDQVPAQLRRWVRADGRILKGLVARREAEIGYI